MTVAARPFPSVSKPAGGEGDGERLLLPGGEGKRTIRIMTIKVPKPLTTKFVEHVKQEGQYLDGNGLYLVVGPSGRTKSWLDIYRFRKRRREMGLGSARDVPLAKARELRDEARALIRRGIDPIEH